jgi:hypothetical protein
LKEPIGVPKPKWKFAEEPLFLGALMILLDRNGGELTYTEAEFQEAVRRWGGRRNVQVRASVIVEDQGRARKARIELSRRMPGSSTSN